MPEETQNADPSILTTQQIMRMVDSLRETITTRLDANDKAVELLQAKADRSPTIGELQERLAALKELLVEIDKRYQSEFVKLSTTTEMMVRQQELALTATKEAVSLAMDASEKAVTKAETAAEKRFESLNEFREQLADQQSTFARTDLVNQRAASLEAKLEDTIRNFESRLADSRDRTATIRDSIRDLESRIKGASLLWGFLIGGGGLVVVVVAFVGVMIAMAG